MELGRWGSLEVGEDADHSGVGLREISIIFIMPNVFFSSSIDCLSNKKVVLTKDYRLRGR